MAASLRRIGPYSVGLWGNGCYGDVQWLVVDEGIPPPPIVIDVRRNGTVSAALGFVTDDRDSTLVGSLDGARMYSQFGATAFGMEHFCLGDELRVVIESPKFRAGQPLKIELHCVGEATREIVVAMAQEPPSLGDYAIVSRRGGAVSWHHVGYSAPGPIFQVDQCESCMRRSPLDQRLDIMEGSKLEEFI